MAAGPLLGLDAATWARLSPLLDDALDLAPGERGAWLERLPPDSADLKDALHRLIAGGEGTGRLHDHAPLDASANGAVEEPMQRAGEVVGGYRLIRELGSGGMGVVWLAERADGLLQRQVALKLPRTGGLPGDLAARMARERDILAALVHPNIARLYDAGIGADGRPLLALEYVEGERIDAFARRHRLDSVARLRLFLQAARAVAYAHAQLVVHRDLKPSNLLVDGQGQVKLLDFGIAKLLDHDAAPPSDLTERGGKVMTPGYASPEQVSGLPMGTRSDVYSLGVVLYELLAGTGPYRPRRDSRAALEDAVLNEEPRRPSEAADAPLRRELRGDLDTIVLHALKKSPDDRYATVDALAEDIERHLENRPVLARPDSLRYTLGRLVRRNRLAFGAAGAVLVAVVAGAGVAIWQGRVAVVERQRANQVKEFVATMLREANAYETGDVGKLSAVDLVRQARKRLDEAAISQPEVRAELATLIGESLLSLGDVDAAEPALERAAAEARRTLGDSHPQALRARLLMSQVGRLRGHAAEQRDEFAALLPLLRARAADEPALLVVGLQHLTLTAIDQGDYVQAERAAVEGAQLAQARLGERHPETVASAILLGMAYRYTKNYEAALPAAERALQLTRQVYPGPGLHPRVVEARSMFGRTLADVGRLQEGVAELQAAAADAQSLFGPSSPMVGVLRQNLVAYRIDLGQLAAADADSAEALRIVALNAAPESYSYAGTAAARGAVLLALRRPAEALALLEPVVATLGRVIGEGHDATLAARAQLALALAGVGRLDAAETALSAAAGHSAGPGVSAATRARLAYAQAVVDRLAGRPADAVRRLQPVLADANPAPRLQRERARARVELGLDQLALGRRGDAMVSFEAALSELARLEIEPTPTRAEALAGLGRARTP